MTTSGGLEMVLILGGEFIMGDDTGDADEKPAHVVKITHFYMDTREVTQKAYESLMEKNPSKFKGPDLPVEQVDWYHAVLYCNMRSLKENLKACYDAKTLACDFSANGYRLPTEAEWEYACRAGAKTKYAYGGDASKLQTYAWFKGNAGQKTHPVAQKQPNAWGLYDMHGNVWEWCQDAFEQDYTKHPGTQAAITSTAADASYVYRGGCWRSGPEECRSAVRFAGPGDLRSDVMGFRIAMDAK
jgi:formylglycine-generating enzyme required for sulfatase activity